MVLHPRVGESLSSIFIIFPIRNQKKMGKYEEFFMYKCD